MIPQILEALRKYGIPERNLAQLARKLYTRRRGCVGYYGAHDVTNGFPLWGITKDKKATHYRLHRLIYCAVNNVKLGRNDLVMPRCGDHGCCHPDHLYVIQRTDYRLPNRSKNLDWDRVRRIRSTPGVKDRTWAEAYGVSRSTVQLIRQNRTWSE